MSYGRLSYDVFCGPRLPHSHIEQPLNLLLGGGLDRTVSVRINFSTIMMFRLAVLALLLLASSVAATKSGVCAEWPYEVFNCLSEFPPASSFCSKDYPCTTTQTVTLTSTITVTLPTVSITTGTTTRFFTADIETETSTTGTNTVTDTVGTTTTVSVCVLPTAVPRQLQARNAMLAAAKGIQIEDRAAPSTLQQSVTKAPRAPAPTKPPALVPLFDQLMKHERCVISTICSCIESCRTAILTQIITSTTTIAPTVSVESTFTISVTAIVITDVADTTTTTVSSDTTITVTQC
jgi:hypothetical protein